MSRTPPQRFVQLVLASAAIVACLFARLPSCAAQPLVADPLAGLPGAVDLPEVKYTGAWVTLAPVALPDELIVLFRLIGGERCLSAGQKVETQELAGGRSWQCLVARGEGKDSLEIARFRIDKRQLQFAWSEGADSFAQAGLISNTAVELVAARTKRLVHLRRALQTAPLGLSFEETTAVYCDIANVPRLDSVIIELDMQSAGRGQAGNWRLLGKGAGLKAHEGRWFAESLNPGQWAVKIETSYGKNLKISATPVFWISDRTKLQPLTKQNLARAIQQLSAYETRLAARQTSRAENTSRIEIKKKKGKGKGKSKPAPSPQASALSRELTGVRKSKGNLVALQQFVAQNQPGSIHFRVSQDFDGYLLPMAKTR
jgi:hypothetical protein